MNLHQIASGSLGEVAFVEFLILIFITMILGRIVREPLPWMKSNPTHWRSQDS